MSSNILSSQNSICFVPTVNNTRINLLQIAMRDCIFFKGFSERFVCKALNAVFLATKGMAILKRRALNVFLPRLVILVCPLCFPEVFSFKLNPAKLIIWLGCVKLPMSPVSARKPAMVSLPSP